MPIDTDTKIIVPADFRNQGHFVRPSAPDPVPVPAPAPLPPPLPPLAAAPKRGRHRPGENTRGILRTPVPVLLGESPTRRIIPHVDPAPNRWRRVLGSLRSRTQRFLRGLR